MASLFCHIQSNLMRQHLYTCFKVMKIWHDDGRVCMRHVCWYGNNRNVPLPTAHTTNEDGAVDGKTGMCTERNFRVLFVGENTQNSTLSDRNFDFYLFENCALHGKTVGQFKSQNRTENLSKENLHHVKSRFVCFYNYPYADFRLSTTFFLVIPRTILLTEKYFIN